MFVTGSALPITDLARACEERGVESLWVPEHPVVPAQHETRYPLSDDGLLPRPYTELPDCFATLAAAAGVTRRLRLGRGVALVPGPPPPAPARPGSRPAPHLALGHDRRAARPGESRARHDAVARGARALRRGRRGSRRRVGADARRGRRPPPPGPHRGRRAVARPRPCGPRRGGRAPRRRAASSSSSRL